MLCDTLMSLFLLQSSFPELEGGVASFIIMTVVDPRQRRDSFFSFFHLIAVNEASVALDTVFISVGLRPYQIKIAGMKILSQKADMLGQLDLGGGEIQVLLILCLLNE